MHLDATRTPSLSAHSTRARTRARNVLPPIQLGPTGNTVSVADKVVESLLLAAALGLLGWLLGANPRTMV